jgi:hypothetical protein
VILNGQDGVGIYSVSPDSDFENHAPTFASHAFTMTTATVTWTAKVSGEAGNRIRVDYNNAGPATPTITESGNKITINYLDGTTMASAVVSAVNASSTLISGALTGTDALYDQTLDVCKPSPLHGGAAPTGLWGDRARLFDNGDDSTGPVNGGQGWPTWDVAVPSYRALWWSLWQTYSNNASTSGAAWVSTGGGTGHSAVASWDSSFGVCTTLSTGTTSTGWHGYVFGQASGSLILLGSAGHQWRYEAAFQIPTLTDGVTDMFEFFAGFNTAASALGSDCAVIDFGAAGGNIEFVCRNASTETRFGSGIAAVAGRNYRVVIIATNTSTVDFYLTQVGQPLPSTPTATITTNVPTHVMTADASIIKTAGTTNRTALLYYQMISLNRLAA